MRIFYKAYNILIRLVSKLILKYHRVKYGNNVKVNGIPFVINKGKFIIGDDVIINSKYKNNPIGGNTFSSFWVKKTGIITIGKGCRISNSAFVSQLRITIGNNVFIGGDCKFYDTDFHSLSINKRTKKPDNDVKSKAIIISDNVFIGGGCVILKGVNIGKNAIIGAGSVLTRSVGDNEIWGGNPARFIKMI